MKIVVFDCEGNGLVPTKLWCLGSQEPVAPLKPVWMVSDYDCMRQVLKNADVLVGHNIWRWDIPHIERLLDIEVKAKLVDTLFISWYLEPSRVVHGLDSYGEDFGIPKPKIDDWDNLTQEEYEHRCAEDVKINTKLWFKQWKQLTTLYRGEKEAWRFIDYLMFKAYCAREQEKARWKLDVDKAAAGLDELETAKALKVEALIKAMPKVPVYHSMQFPKKKFKKNGELSAIGERWEELCKKHGKPVDNIEEIRYIKDYKEPNPGSHLQVKQWLFSLGWEPETFKYKRDKETGEIKRLEQVGGDDPDKPGEVCDSIKRLFINEPALKDLDGLGILSHRIGILKGFLRDVDDEGYIKARVSGLTNTLRFKHAEIVNLPGVDKPYGELIRSCLIAPEGYELCGWDMTALEDNTKKHYMWPYDPQYVKEMSGDGFDPHLDLCVMAGMLTDAQVADHKAKRHNWSAVRQVGKKVNYTCVYGAGVATIARAAGVKEKEAKVLRDAYWERNWAVEQIAEDCRVIRMFGTKWLKNPVSGFLYSLRAEKDRFSTLNQGTGVYVFDMVLMEMMKRRKQLTGQMHDEGILTIKKGNRERCSRMLQASVDAVNVKLKMNVRFDIGLDFGNTYAEIH